MPGSRTAKQRQEEAARNSRINKMLIAMVVIFGTCWFPINLINLAADTIDLGELLSSERRIDFNLGTSQKDLTCH